MNENRPGPEREERGPSPSPTASSSSRPLPQVPDYELLRLIGRGAYGEVWLGRSLMGGYQAIKVVYRQNFDHDRPYEREFAGIQKFEPLSRNHDSQVDILHVGRNQAQDYFYYVMELADDASEQVVVKETAASEARNPTSQPGKQERPEGVSGSGPGTLDWQSYVPKTLKRELQVRGRLPVIECVNLGLTLTTALEHLHKNGLVHRDVKPSNIIFVGGRPKLADIGLVSSLDDTRSYVGTPGFAPPEGPGTASADLYSLGKMLYEAATGRDRQEFPELPTRLGSTPEEEAALIELNQVLLKACDNDPTQRYQSVESMRADLAILARGSSLIRRRSTRKRLVILTRCGIAALFLITVATLAWRLTPAIPRKASPRNSAVAAAETEPAIPDQAKRFVNLREAIQSRASTYQRLTPYLGQGQHPYRIYKLNTHTLRFRDRYFDAIRFTTPPANSGFPDMVWSFYQVSPQRWFDGWTIFPAAGNMERGFRGFCSRLATDYQGLVAATNALLRVQAMPGKWLEPQADYLLVFGFAKPDPLEMQIALAFVPPGTCNETNCPSMEHALGLVVSENTNQVPSGVGSEKQ